MPQQEKDLLFDRSLVDNTTTAGANKISKQQQQQQPQLQRRQQHQKPQQQQRRRLIVYLTRPSTATRYVTNEKEILASLRAHLDPSYELVVLDSTIEHHSIKRMHMSWVRYASGNTTHPRYLSHTLF